MKIVDLKTLLVQRCGVLFATYQPGQVGEICMYGGPSTEAPDELDFVYATMGLNFPFMREDQHNWHDFWMEHLEKGGEAKPDFKCWGRNAMNDPKEMFVLLDKEDVASLFRHVAHALVIGYEVPETELRNISANYLKEEDPHKQ